MAWGDAFYRKATAKVEAFSGEHVDLIALGSRRGAARALAADGAMAPRDRMTAPGGGKGARLPLSFLVALTPTALRVYKQKQFWGRITVKEELGALPRAGLKLDVRGNAGKVFDLTATDGSSVSFEMMGCAFTTNFAASLESALA